MGDFYVTLQSNSCLNIFPKNTISDFKNRLSAVISLKPNAYEVGLVECSYTYGNAFLKEGDVIATLTKQNLTTKKSNVKSTRNIRTIDELLNELKVLLPVIDIRVDDNMFKCSIQLAAEEIVDFSDKVCDILGIDCKSCFKSQKNIGVAYDIVNEKITDGTETFQIEGTHPVFPNCGNTKLFVYCNIVAPQYVADVMAPCLRVLSYDGEYRKQVTHSFQQGQFMDLSLAEFDVIHLYIRNESGEPVSFEFGNFTATLRFRLRKYLL